MILLFIIYFNLTFKFASLCKTEVLLMNEQQVTLMRVIQ